MEAGKKEMEVETEAEVEAEVWGGLPIDLFRHSTKLPLVVKEDMEEGKEVGEERRTPPVRPTALKYLVIQTIDLAPLRVIQRLIMGELSTEAEEMAMDEAGVGVERSGRKN